MSLNGHKAPHRWDEHPGVTSHGDLPRAQKFADTARDFMGSWTFLASVFLFTALWAGTQGFGVDPAPYSGLNVLQSTGAAFQTIILLIAAKRADQVSAQLANHDRQILEALREILDQSREPWVCKVANEAQPGSGR